MPPKQSAKRRAQGDAGPARKKASPKPEPTYDTYDEAMEGGVEFEEKGERYRDGEKVSWRRCSCSLGLWRSRSVDITCLHPGTAVL